MAMFVIVLTVAHYVSQCVFETAGGRKDKWKPKTLTSSTKDSPP